MKSGLRPKDFLREDYLKRYGKKCLGNGRTPDYLKDFKFSAGINAKKKLRAYRKYGQSEMQEEKDLKQLERDMKVSAGRVAKTLKSFGLVSLPDDSHSDNDSLD